MTLTLAPWFAKKQGLFTREFEGEILRETEKAILFKGHVSVAPSQTCHNCGKRIDNPISRLVGYGPWCSDNLGIPRPEGLTEVEMERVRQEVSVRTEREMWVPKSVVKGRVG